MKKTILSRVSIMLVSLLLVSTITGCTVGEKEDVSTGESSGPTVIDNREKESKKSSSSSSAEKKVSKSKSTAKTSKAEEKASTAEVIPVAEQVQTIEEYTFQEATDTQVADVNTEAREPLGVAELAEGESVDPPKEVEQPVASEPEKEPETEESQAESKPESKPEVSSPTPSAPEQKADLRVSDKVTNTLNLREGPSITDLVIDSLPTGTLLTSLGLDTSGNWYKVETSNGTVGYVSAEFVINLNDELEEETPPIESEPEENAGENSEETPTTVNLTLKTTDALNLRKGPSTSDEKILTLAQGAILTATELSADKKWYKVKTESGKEGYVSAEYTKEYIAEETPKTPETEQPQPQEPTPGNSNGGTNQKKVTISTSGATISQYRTLYITGNIQGSTTGISWVSDNPEIATVTAFSQDAGKALIYAKSTGSTTIRLKDDAGNVGTVAIKVQNPEAVRFTYADSNTPSSGSTFNLIAVTDTGKTAVKFDISGPDGNTSYESSSVSRTETQGPNTVNVFSIPVSFDTAGNYSVVVSSRVGSNGWNASSAQNTFKIVSTTDETTTSRDSRAASSKIINFIAAREGASSEAYIDLIGTGAPLTVGYGIVVNDKSTFYNNLTETELKASLTASVNNGGYVSAVENYRSRYDIAMNQQQFDALVSFAYNLGGGVFKLDYETFRVINNATAFNGATTGTLNVIDLPLYAETSTTSKKLANVPNGTKVEVQGSAVVDIRLSSSSSVSQRWYQVKYNNQVGWVQAGGVNIGGAIDLQYIDEQMLGSNLLQWNIANGSRIVGLVKRRVAEAKIFCYGGYDASYDNAFNPGFDIPKGFTYNASGETGSWALG
ncbi:SH3 domain-containing protein [Scatolibacter rhodanostii]|uniref:SH3 domain-containing protein n=1 Tax=Scatolibacter rhodanostii TaxID=2014781 RepID=UPI0013566040|nr:SH3 domain-containing protein [Scatolibacter rhodanostii]